MNFENEEYMKSELIGKTITFMKLSDNKDSLSIEVMGNIKYKLETEASCCSCSWIEHIDSVDFPATIIDFIEKEVPPTYIYPEPQHQDCLKVYFYEIKTDKGSIDIEMRNESNGYYGGSLYLLKE